MGSNCVGCTGHKARLETILFSLPLQRDMFPLICSVFVFVLFCLLLFFLFFFVVVFLLFFFLWFFFLLPNGVARTKKKNKCTYVSVTLRNVAVTSHWNVAVSRLRA